MNLRQKNTRGFTLVEIMLVIGIITIISASIFIGFQSKMDLMKSQKEVSYLSKISSSLNKTLSTAKTSSDFYAAMTNSNIIAIGFVPEEKIVGTSILDSWGGNINFGSIILTKPAYSITYSSLPIRGCNNITTNVQTSFDYVSINGNVVKNISSGANFMINPTVIAPLCNNNTNTVVFANLTYNSVFDPVVPMAGNAGIVDPNLIPAAQSTPVLPASTACPNNSVWNGNFCSCANGSGWDGTQCRTFGAYGVGGFCSEGQTWNGSACINIGNGQIYAGNRYLANSYPTVIAGGVPSAASTVSSKYQANASCTDGKISNNSTLTCGCPTGTNWNGNYCEACPYGSWNGSRCVAPAP